MTGFYLGDEGIEGQVKVWLDGITSPSYHVLGMCWDANPQIYSSKLGSDTWQLGVTSNSAFKVNIQSLQSLEPWIYKSHTFIGENLLVKFKTNFMSSGFMPHRFGAIKALCACNQTTGTPSGLHFARP